MSKPEGVAMRSIAIIAFTRRGCALAIRLKDELGATDAFAHTAFSVQGPARYAGDAGIDAYESLESWTAAQFGSNDALVFVGATGIAVRAIAPHVRDKFHDPAVVSVDEAGLFVVPLLSGHVGGANELARTVAQVTGGQAVVSTATDVNSLFAVDEWAARNGFAIVERVLAKEVSAALLDGRTVGFASDFELFDTMPNGVVAGDADLGFTVSYDEGVQPFERTLHLVPRDVTLGVGCKRDTKFDVLEQVVSEALMQARISPRAVAAIASIDVKADEPAIAQLASKLGCDLKFYTADELAAVPGEFPSSDFVARTVGVGNVCERAACAAGGVLLQGRFARDGVTVAIAGRTGSTDKTAADSA